MNLLKQKQLKTNKMSEWKSIKDEGYPKSDFACLVTDGKSIVVAEYVDQYAWAFYYSKPNFRSSSVTHWMYLPEPPTH